MSSSNLFAFFFTDAVPRWCFWGSFCYLCFIFVFVMLSCLFLAALWSAAWKGWPIGSLVCYVFFVTLLWCLGIGVMRESRNFCQGESRSIWQKFWPRFFFLVLSLWQRILCFLSPRLILQKSNGKFQRSILFFKVPEGVQLFPGGPTSSMGGLFPGVSNCLFPIETHMTLPPPPPPWIRTWVWYLIVSIPDRCLPDFYTLLEMAFRFLKWQGFAFVISLWSASRSITRRQIDGSYLSNFKANKAISRH